MLSFGLNKLKNIDTENAFPKNEVGDVQVIDDTSIDQHSASFVTFDCTEPHCVMQFRREDRLRAHLLMGSHKFIVPSFRLLDKSAITYKESLENDNLKEIPILTSTNRTAADTRIPTVALKEGWALFVPRAKISFTAAQRSYLIEKYDEGEKSGAKWDPSKLAEVYFLILIFSKSYRCFSIIQHMQTAKAHGEFMFQPDQFLTVSQIK